MSNRLTKGRALFGEIRTNNNVSVGTRGFTAASATLNRLRISVASLTTGEKDTGIVLPVNTIVEGVYLHVKTAESTGSTKQVSVGLLSTQPNGMTATFLLNASTASAGVVIPSQVAGSVTAGSGFQEGSAASGRFMKYYVVGPTASSTAINISYTPQSAHTELVADIIIDYEQIAL